MPELHTIMFRILVYYAITSFDFKCSSICDYSNGKYTNI